MLDPASWSTQPETLEVISKVILRHQDLKTTQIHLGKISDTTASAFLAEVGDYKGFSSYKHLIAFAGIDPSIHQSGKFEGASKISKRGNRHLRHIIYIMTSCVVRQDNVFRVYYLRRRAEGLPFKKAILATAHKLVRVIFSMLLNRTTYEKRG